MRQPRYIVLFASPVSNVQTDDEEQAVSRAGSGRKTTFNLRYLSLALVAAMMALWPSTSVASVPDWLRSLAQQPPKHYADDVNSVELLDETVTTVKDNGEIVTHWR